MGVRTKYETEPSSKQARLKISKIHINACRTDNIAVFISSSSPRGVAADLGWRWQIHRNVPETVSRRRRRPHRPQIN